MGDKGFSGEQLSLIGKKWDISRWRFHFDIDRRWDFVYVHVYGYGGEHTNFVGLEGPLERPCANWEHVFEHACTSLRDQLQMQLDDTL